VGHSDIAPLRKQDPGEKFPWKKLKNKGLGVWHNNSKLKLKKINEKKMIDSFFKNLYKFGYRYCDTKKRGKNDKYLIKAFQRRFLPKNVTGAIDQKTFIISHFLANHLKN